MHHWPGSPLTLGGILFTIMSASGHLLFISCIRKSSCCTTSATGCLLARSFPAHCRTTTSELKSHEKMAGTLSLNTGSSHPRYIKDVADTCCRDTLWAKPRTSEVPMIATDGLSGTWVEAEDGCLGWEAEDGCLERPRLRPGVDEGWSEDTAWSVCTGHRKGRRTDFGAVDSGLSPAIFNVTKASIIYTHSSQEWISCRDHLIFQVSEITGHMCFFTVTFLLHIRAVVGRQFAHSLKTL